MELKEFISETLKQITEGIKDAQKYLTDSSIPATINPWSGKDAVENIEFDIAVTTNSSNNAGVKGGIKVAGMFSIGSDIENINSQEKISRIKFKVQMELPRQEGDSNIQSSSLPMSGGRDSKHRY